MPEDYQEIYDELNRRGVFKSDTEAQAIGHELRRRGVVKDATQGGLVTPPKPKNLVANATKPSLSVAGSTQKLAVTPEEAKRRNRADTLRAAEAAGRPDLNYAQGASQSVTGKSKLRSSASVSAAKPTTIGQRAGKIVAKAGEVVSAPFKKVDEMVGRAILESGGGTAEAQTRYKAAQAKNPGAKPFVQERSFWQLLTPLEMEALQQDTSIGGGLARFGANLLTPGNALPLGAVAKSAKGAGRVMAGAFGAPAAIGSVGQVANAENPGQVVEGLLNMLVGGAGLKHAATPTPKPPPPVRANTLRKEYPLPPKAQPVPKGEGRTVFPKAQGQTTPAASVPLKPQKPTAERVPKRGLYSTETEAMAQAARELRAEGIEKPTIGQVQERVAKPAEVPAVAPVEAVQTPKPAEGVKTLAEATERLKTAKSASEAGVIARQAKDTKEFNNVGDVKGKDAFYKAYQNAVDRFGNERDYPGLIPEEQGKVLQEEYNTIRARVMKKDGTPKVKADPADLARMDELVNLSKAHKQAVLARTEAVRGVRGEATLTEFGFDPGQPVEVVVDGKAEPGTIVGGEGNWSPFGNSPAIKVKVEGGTYHFSPSQVRAVEIPKPAESTPIPPPSQSQKPLPAPERRESAEGRVISPVESTPLLQNPAENAISPPTNAENAITGAKNATTEPARAERGASPIERQAYTLVGEAYNQGKAAVEGGTTDPRALASAVATKPRPLTAEEVGALAYDRAQIIREHDAATAELAKAVDANNTAKIAELQAKQERLLADLDTNDNALVKGGREQSAAFAARKMMVGQDYSFAGVQQRAKAAKGAPLTPQESKQIETLTARLKDTESRLTQAESALKEAQAQKPATKQNRGTPKFTLSDTDRVRIDAAKERIRQKASQVGTVPDVTILADVIEIGSVYVQAGVRSLNEWRTQMKADVPGIDDDTLNAAWRHISVNQGRETRLGKQIGEFGKNIAAGKFELPKRPTPPEATPNVKQLQVQRDMLRTQIQREIVRMKPKTLGQKAADVAGVPRSLLTSFDLSAPLRQGSVLTLSNPRLAVKNIVPMLRAFTKEAHAKAVEIEIKERANYADYESSGLYLAPLDELSSLSKREEAFMSTLAEKIPGVRPSERAYVTYLNKLRADSFDMFQKQLPNAKPEELAAIADFINTATGRGKLGATGERAATLLNNIFFSPRYLTSRMQMLAGEPLYKGTGRSRALVARTYLQYGGAVLAIVQLAKAGGATVETDPNHTDFMKIKVGKKVFDVLAGLQQAGTFLSRMVSGKKTSAAGNTSDLTKPGYKGDTRADLAIDFARGKAAPIPGSAWNLLEGKNIVGEPANLKTEAVRLTLPMSWPDVYAAAKQEGMPAASAVFLMSLFGVGANFRTPRTQTGGSSKSGLPTIPDPMKSMNRKINSLGKVTR